MLLLRAKMAGFNKVQFSEFSFGSGADTEKNKSKGDGHRETHVLKHCEFGHGQGGLLGYMLIRTGLRFK